MRGWNHSHEIAVECSENVVGHIVKIKYINNIGYYYITYDDIIEYE